VSLSSSLSSPSSVSHRSDPPFPRAELDLPAAGSGRTAERWSRLASWGRVDLPRARLAEGHVDALTVLREAGAEPVPGALYGVWAARSGGTGAMLADGRLTGLVRFCSGAQRIDRALVVAAAPEGSRIVDVDLARPGVTPRPGAWQAAAMRASDTEDVEFDLAVSETIGAPGFYTARPGFWWGGAGVAAVWLGGARGIVDALHSELSDPDAHQLAHLGALHASLAAADALLERTAAAIDADPTRSHRDAAWTLRAAVERTCRDVLDLVPRTAGVAVLSAGLADRLADLGMYVRQHHGERDLAALGDAVRGSR